MDNTIYGNILDGILEALRHELEAWEPKKIETDERELMEVAAHVVQVELKEFTENKQWMVWAFGIMMSMVIDKILERMEERKNGGNE